MNDRSGIAVALIVCGTICILTVLGIVALISYQLIQQGGAYLSQRFSGVGDWVVTLLVLGGLAGGAMVTIGIWVGTRK